MLNKFTRYTGVFVALLLIICIRLFEDRLFYDPFLDFFKSDFQNKSLPVFDLVRFFLNILLRYLANTIFSIAIIYFLFQNKMYFKIALVLFIVLFIFLVVVLFYLLFSGNPNYMVLFYVRRFLIQPLLLLLLIPAFYVQKIAEKQ